MVSGGELYAGIGAFKTMLNVAKNIKDMSDATARNAAVMDLQERLLSAQIAQAEMVRRISQLEAEMRRMAEWEGEKERYELKQLPLECLSTP